MHPDSLDDMCQAFLRHASADAPGRVLDLTPADQGDGLRQIWQAGGWDWQQAEPAAADAVLLANADGAFDAVISQARLATTPFFWLAFLEMARVLRPGGLMVHSAPSRGIAPAAQTDCWRFYRDGMAALAQWAGLDLVEATTDWAPEMIAQARASDPGRLDQLHATRRRRGSAGGDTIGVFRKTRALWQSPAAAHIRHFAADFERQARPLRFAAA
jgi:SAM-dependent methyltransferase